VVGKAKVTKSGLARAEIIMCNDYIESTKGMQEFRKLRTTMTQQREL